MGEIGTGASEAPALAREHLAAMFERSAAQWSVEPERFAVVTFNEALATWWQQTYGTPVRCGIPLEELVPRDAAAFWRGLFDRALRDGTVRARHISAEGKVVRLSLARLERAGTVLGISARAVGVRKHEHLHNTVADSQEHMRRVVASTLNTSRLVEAQQQLLSRAGGEPSTRPRHVMVSRALLEDAPVAIGVARDLEIDYVNHACAAIFRIPREALVGRPILELWAPEARPEIAARLGGMVPGQRPFEFEGTGVRADGSPFPVHASVGPLRGLGGVVVFLTDMTERRAMESQLHQTLDELRRLRDRLQQDNLALRQQITIQQGPTAILGQSPAILQAVEQAKAVASTDSVVLVTGETGTGKELLARAIHEMSPRAAAPMVMVNCAALPAGLIESELFGREKGAFTGANRQRGRFESAHGSTLFLDEVGELPVEVQAKLLRVLQDGRFERLGSTDTVSVNVRVIAATNRDLGRMVEEGRFRADLYYRLRVFPIEMPPLRTRTQDIPLLVWDAVRFFSSRLGKTIDFISWETMQQLQHHPWPGNVRELRNLVERSVILSTGRALSVAFDPGDAPQPPPVTLADAQRRHILTSLERAGWRVGGADGAAARLALRRSTLNSLMKRLGISRPTA